MDDFPSSFHSLYKIFFLLGLAPYEINFNYISQSPASKSIQKRFFSITIILIIVAISEYGRSSFVSNSVVDSKTTKLILALNSYATGPIVSAGIIFSHLRYSTIHVDSINTIYEVDKILSIHGIFQDHRAEKKRSILLVLLMQVTIFYHELQLNFVTFSTNNISQLTAILSVYMASVVFITVIAQFVIWASGLIDRFVKLNQIMEGCNEAFFLKATTEISKGFELCSVHRKLCGIVDKLAYIYSIPIVLEHGVLFLTLVVDTYFFYRNYVVTKNRVGSYYLALVLITKDIFLVVLLYVVCDRANTIIYQAEKTGVIMHSRTVNATNKKAKRAISICSLQLLQQKAYFNICGMFPLDLSCFGSIVGFVTSYLIVYIQFQGSS